jgi:formate C-acetyltransferase
MDYRATAISPKAEERIRTLKDRSVQAEQEVCVERARLLTETFRSSLSDPMIMRRGKALKNVLENMTIFIDPGELIVGNQAGRLRAAPIFPEYTVDWIIREIDQLPQRPGDRFLVRPEVREELLDICAWWQGRTVHDRCLAVLPFEVQEAYEIGALSAQGNMTSGDGHIMLDFPKVLRVGLRGVIQQARTALEALDPADPEGARKRIILSSIPVAFEGVIRFARRYAEEARRLLQQENDQTRRQELEKIAAACSRVPEFPPETFYEAVQAVWFVHLVSQIESNGHSMSLGRFDQYMYDLYKRDIESGALSEGEALELLCCLWIKMFGVVKIRPWVHTRFSGGGPTYQNLTLGGLTPQGQDATNPLTMVCLDSVALTRLTQPNVSARIHSGSPRPYLRKCLEVIRLGFGMPALHNDELMIPSLLARGVSLEDANNYALVGCIEPIIPGKHGYRAAGMSFTNFPKILELALNGGRDPRTGSQLVPDSGDLSRFSDFEEVMEAFRKQMAYFVRLRIAGEYVIDQALEEIVPDAFCTGLVQDCIGRGKTPKEGGAVYDMVTGPETGVTNVGNSLAAIRKLVFEDGRLSGDQLKKALETDFAGAEGERIRQLLLNKAPKFGNDDDLADHLARETYMIFIRELAKYPNARFGRGPRGCLNYPCTATISANVPCGLSVGASPEGRHAGEPLAEGCSPHRGTDRKGPTAVFNSVSKMPNALITGGNLLNQRLHPDTLKTEEGIGKLEALIRSFFQKKGWHVQFNVVSSETLRAAQHNPERYRDLVVRVAGYSALFTTLEPETQEDIIARTEHVI